MAKITPDSSAGTSGTSEKRPRAEKLSAGEKICVMLGFFYETAYNNKKLQIGYAVIDDLNEDENALSENGIIHIDSLLIRDSVNWKHAKWSAGAGFDAPYDNEDHDDIFKIILGCPAVKCTFVDRTYTTRNGDEKTVLEIQDWRKVPDAGVYLHKAGIDKLIASCEQSFEKIIDYRVRRGDTIERAVQSSAVSGGDSTADFDQYVADNTGHDPNEIPF